jgi:hypothetical protein
MLHIRRIPELRFREDRSYEGARRIEQVLADVLPPDESLDAGRQAPEGAEDASAGDAARDDDGPVTDPGDPG